MSTINYAEIENLRAVTVLLVLVWPSIIVLTIFDGFIIIFVMKTVAAKKEKDYGN